MAGFVYRQNNVPEWQRLHQRHDGLRTWVKGPRAKMMLYPYFVILGLGFAGSMYGMGRAVFNKKTWW
ncbi:hypothetical protein TWF696_003921 [Orbilia brochopaga]|uniref:Uncharacterized protein n=2 Tax=Orbiliaceae TaxID=47021 RepID=A0AAD6IZV7_DREDA|nr:hypothetical protein Dda_4032 [Drechslerella dactyloides]